MLKIGVLKLESFLSLLKQVVSLKAGIDIKIGEHLAFQGLESVNAMIYFIMWRDQC